MHSIQYKIILLFFLSSNHAFCSDTMHFFSTTPLYPTAQSDRFPLSNIEAIARHGSTHQSLNRTSQRVALFDLYGTHQLSALGRNITFAPTDLYGQALVDLASLPSVDTFGAISIGGHFSLSEYFIHVSKNFINGFFFSACFPVRHVEVNKIYTYDISNLSNINKRYTEPWDVISHNIPSFLKYYGITLQKYKITSFGDVSGVIGWSHSNYHTHYLDYIDTQLSMGLLFPTSNLADVHHPLSFSVGYNGHCGVSCSIALGIGYLDWLSLDMRINSVILVSKKQLVSLKTDAHQQGIIFLYTKRVNVTPGILMNYSCALKADHLLQGISLCADYAYSAQKSTKLALHNTPLALLSKDDDRFKGWSMHIIGVRLEYDYNTMIEQSYPVICLEYRWIAKGRRVFHTAMWQIGASVYTTWNF